MAYLQGFIEIQGSSVQFLANTNAGFRFRGPVVRISPSAPSLAKTAGTQFSDFALADSLKGARLGLGCRIDALAPFLT
jgi:hypothetical protein